MLSIILKIYKLYIDKDELNCENEEEATQYVNDIEFIMKKL